MLKEIELPAKPNKTLVIFVGGALDHYYQMMLAGVYTPYRHLNADQQNIYYALHHERKQISKWVKHWQAHEQTVCLIGHSWGCQSVMDAAHKIKTKNSIEYLITLDPVSRGVINQHRKKPASVKRWVNIYIDVKRSPLERSNLIAILGGRWSYRQFADKNICLREQFNEEVTHAKARLMFMTMYKKIAAC
jgi:pimeloyl-ACP methyl ester carboxylesterase